MKLYEIATSLEQALMADEFDPETIDTLVIDMKAKAAAIIAVSTQITSFADMCKAEEKRIAERRKFAENRNARLMEYLKSCMETAGVFEMEVGTNKLCIQKNPPAVVITNELALPAKYIEIVQTSRVDKVAIKEALKRGEEVEGAHLEATTRLAVK